MAASRLPLLGETVQVRGQRATVRYAGQTEFADGNWVGLELQRPVGAAALSMSGHRGPSSTHPQLPCPSPSATHGLPYLSLHSGRNDGSVRGVRYFTCEPEYGLFVPPSHISPAPVEDGGAPSALEQPKPEVASAWADVESLHEGEALQAARDGERVVKHLSQRYPNQTQGPARERAAAAARAKQHKPNRPATLSRKLSHEGDEAYRAHMDQLDDALPAGYSGPDMAGDVTAPDMARLTEYIKRHVSECRPGPAVPKRVAMQLLLRIKNQLETLPSNIVDMRLDSGRLVVVGDTHGQLADFCWILRSHGHPAPENVYLVNGDVADRGRNAVEILLIIFGYMLAAPGTIHFNRGNHESVDMNVRSYREGGGFAMEVGAKYDSAVFTLFQDVFSLLPLCVRVNNEVLVLHGGLCRSGAATLDELRAIDRRRPVPVSTADPRDVLFFDTMWADPQPTEGFGSSTARGAGCVTFGPDVTRRFCEINRLRMIVRSHEVPKMMTGVQVQHDGRLITVFSASNYCGRIGNTGGTMILSPQLDYQLMEHWAPTLAELVAMEQQEAEAAAASAAAAARVEASLGSGGAAAPPKEHQSRFSEQATEIMQSDVLGKMKELIALNKPRLQQHYVAADAAATGRVTQQQLVRGLREALPGGVTLPWDDFVRDLATFDAQGLVRYQAFLNRYRLGSDDEAWQSRVLGALYAKLCDKDLSATLAFFDINQDGEVTRQELSQVLREESIGLEGQQIDVLASSLLKGQHAVKTTELLDNFTVKYKETDKDAGGGPRATPAWAQSLLDTVSKQCAARHSSTLELFSSFDSNGDGFISFGEFQQAMMKLGGHAATATPEQAERVAQMLLDLAAWVDRNGSGTINYMEFCSAFRVSAIAAATAAEEAAHVEPHVPGNATVVEQLMEQLCALFYQHRWSLKRAFDYFDANGDGVLSPHEFKAAVQGLSSMDDEVISGAQPLRLTDEQADRLVASLDRDGDGVIDYEEFLEGIGPRDQLEL